MGVDNRVYSWKELRLLQVRDHQDHIHHQEVILLIIHHPEVPQAEAIPAPAEGSEKKHLE